MTQEVKRTWTYGCALSQESEMTHIQSSDTPDSTTLCNTKSKPVEFWSELLTNITCKKCLELYNEGNC